MRILSDKANAIKDLGDVPNYALYQDLASNMESFGRIEEARAWHRLVLRDQPEDPVSKAAVQRLGKPAGGEKP
jgi:hypothetical protein